MNCKCIEEKIKDVQGVITNHESIAEVVDEPTVRESSFYTKNWKLGYAMFIHIDTKYKRKKKDGTAMKNITTDTLPIKIKFCPMCGQKIEEN